MASQQPVPCQARIAPSDPGMKDLRNAFACFGTGVTVVTTRHPEGKDVGVTANSFSSVSLNPPIVLWSLAAHSPSLDAFRRAGRFAINVLSVEQVELSRRFSRPAEDKFEGLELSCGLGGLPLLKHSAAIIECSVLSAQQAGDHVLFLGQVDRYSYEKTSPLLFCNGRYARAIDLTAA